MLLIHWFCKRDQTGFLYSLHCTLILLQSVFRLAMNKRFGDRTVSSLLQDDADGALSAPEMPSIRRDRGKRIS